MAAKPAKIDFRISQVRPRLHERLEFAPCRSQIASRRGPDGPSDIMTASPVGDEAMWRLPLSGPLGVVPAARRQTGNNDDARPCPFRGRLPPIDWLVTLALAFNHPNEVLEQPGPTQAERRAILHASWASDARAVEDAHWMRRLDNGSMVPLSEVLDALRKLDGETSPLTPRRGRRTILSRLPRLDPRSPIVRADHAIIAASVASANSLCSSLSPPWASRASQHHPASRSGRSTAPRRRRALSPA